MTCFHVVPTSAVHLQTPCTLYPFTLHEHSHGENPWNAQTVTKIGNVERFTTWDFHDHRPTGLSHAWVNITNMSMQKRNAHGYIKVR